MSIYDDDWGKPGENSTPNTAGNRYNQIQNYVPAAPADRRPIPTASPISVEHHNWLAATGDGLQALPSVRETATPIERAIGLGIRLIPFTAAWLVLAGGLLLVLKGPVIPFLVFALLTAITYYLMSRQEYDYSAAGLERHKADLAHDLQAQRLEQEHELKRAALNSYIKHLEGDR
jgi:hypothetical protein